MIPARIAVSAGVAASARELSPATASVGRAFRATASAGIAASTTLPHL
ncbi:hypothetical protein [Brevibacterium casei]|nr:hypothetical protein [Brevibacterium casei]MCT2184212.1 hypothetical protein [Brevibacterium casei]SII03121.1 Uncharacterised protein [Mycobacteroides abscessus subsp. abscessus]